MYMDFQDEETAAENRMYLILIVLFAIIFRAL